MHDHNLDDLIIDSIEPKNSKTKSFLTIVALLIVVLIVAIILTKIILKAPNENRLDFEENTTDLIAPELQLKETPKPKKVKEEPVLSDIIDSKPKEPVVESNKEEIIEKSAAVIKKDEPVLSNILDQDIEAPVTQTTKPVMVQEPVLAPKEKDAKDAEDIAHWEAVQEKRRAEKVHKEEKTEEVVKEVVEVTKSIEPKNIKTDVVKTQKPAVDSVERTVKKPQTTQHVAQTISTGTYYVQVGSFKKQPSARFISVISNNGFNYKIQKSTIDGMNKLLIGPYGDSASVNLALTQVRDRINKSAFIVKGK